MKRQSEPAPVEALYRSSGFFGGGLSVEPGITDEPIYDDSINF